MGQRAALALAAAALAAVLLAGAAPTAGAQAGGGGQEPLAAVQAVLDARVAALGAGDRQGWMATVDPRAPAAFAQAQGRIFDGLRTLPVERYELSASTEETGDLSAGLADRYGAPAFLPETEQRLRFRGYDDRDAVDSLWLTFVQRDGRWFVGGDDDLRALGLDTARGPWDFGPVEGLESEHFLTIFHPGQRARAEALAAIAEDAMDVIVGRWDQPWTPRLPLVLPGSKAELAELIQSTADLDNFVAFVAYNARREPAWETTAPRIYIQDENLSRYDRPFQVETLVHELAHAAGAPVAGPFIPAWVHEGVADWIATGRSTTERKPRGGDTALPRDFEFSTGPRTTIIRAYNESRSATSYLARRAGRGVPTALFKALGETTVAPGSVDFHVDAALRRAAGLSLAELEVGWSR